MSGLVPGGPIRAKGSARIFILEGGIVAELGKGEREVESRRRCSSGQAVLVIGPL